MDDAFTPEEERIKELEKLLERAVGWLDHPPENPNHYCGNPDSPCDQLCVEWSRFCTDYHAMTRALKCRMGP